MADSTRSAGRSDPARLLDVTRLASRAGRGLTGVDRVELAYLRRLPTEPGRLWGLARTATGYVLLDRAGLEAFRARVEGHVPWGPPDLAARLSRRLTPDQRRAEADLRRLSRAGCSRYGLGWMLRRRLPARIVYLNTGHSNLSPRVLRCIRQVQGARVAVFLHDTIPLDFPDHQREGTVPRFRAMLDLMGQADVILCNSRQTRADAQRHLAHMGTPPQMIVAHLGVDTPRPDPAALPAGLPPPAPWFVTVGTIEPRKNHALLLDVWEDLARDLPADEVPALVIVGSRGWRNEAVFARLDALPPGGPVIEAAGLSDGAVAALVRGARALLMPSIAEGYGLPPIEAAALGTPVMCSDLVPFREILGDIPVYLDPGDRYSWAEAVKTAARRIEPEEPGTASEFVPPTWEDHFKIVLRAI